MQLAFHKGTGILAVAIEYGTHSCFSHCELVFADGMSFSARAEDSPAVNILPFDSSDGRWVLVPVPGKYPEVPVRIWAQAQVGRGYDWAADIAFALPFLPDSRRDLMCAGACVAALQIGGLFTSFIPSRVSPGELYAMAVVLESAGV